MSRTLLFLSAAMIAISHSPEPVAAHDDPAVIVARRCAARVDQAVERNRNIAAEKTTECLQTIRGLLAAGNDERAVLEGRRCIEAAEDRAAASAIIVERVCTACRQRLRELGAFDLAERVDGVCDDAIEDLRTILQRQRNAIQNALD